VLDILPESASQRTEEESTRNKFGYMVDEIKTTLEENKLSPFRAFFAQQNVTRFSDALAFSKDEWEKSKFYKPILTSFICSKCLAISL